MWGQNEDRGATVSSRESAARLIAAIAAVGRDDLIKVRPFSTQSHAKIVVADDGKGAWRALVGSCNWLGWDSQSFEASIRLRDPALVGQLIECLANLAPGRVGFWATEMAVLGHRVADMVRGNGRTVPMRLLFAPDHEKLLLDARDRAARRIFVLSHRLGIAARSVALLPVLTAVRTNNVSASIFYGRTTGPLTGLHGAALIAEFARQGVPIRPVHTPRLHAKVLGWDDDAFAVSSQNWLAADPADGAGAREVGVFIQAPRIADNFIRVFENARVD
jgi:phosphatidylserine/phosphatidylglycerophosphate/cardiolipin synthase-like enzyme